MGIQEKTIIALAMGIGISSCVHHQKPGTPSFTVHPVESKDGRLGNEEKCTELITDHNDATDTNRINITFVAVNYDTKMVNAVALKTLDYHQLYGGLLADEAIASNAHLFNFWVRDEPIHVNIPEKYEVDGKKRKKKNRYSIEVRTDENIAYGHECGGPSRNLIFFLVDRKFTSTAQFPHWHDIRWHQLNLEHLASYQEQFKNEYDIGCRVRYNRCEEGIDDPICAAIEDVAGSQDKKYNKDLCALITNDLQFKTSIIASNSTGSAAHEFHHLFEGAQDLYENSTIFAEHVESYGSEEAILEELREEAIDCFPAKTKQECKEQAPWSIVNSEKTSCFKGCEYTKSVAGVALWRPHKDTMMRNSSNKDLGWWGEYRFCVALEAYTGEAQGICQDYGFGLDTPLYQRHKQKLYLE